MFIGAVLFTAAHADTLEIRGSNLDDSYSCSPGQAVEIEGSGHDLTVDGDCGAVTITGSGSEVHLDGVASIDVTGSDIHVGWRRNLSGRESLPVSKTGSGLTVSQDASPAPPTGPAPTVPPLKVGGSSKTRTLACERGQNVVVTGSNHHVTVSGDCGLLRVDGSTIEVSIDGVAEIRVDGSMNRVTYQRNLSGQPKLPVAVDGAGNKVTGG